MLFRHKDQHKINFIDKDVSQEEISSKKESNEKSELVPAQKLNSSDSIESYNGTARVLSAGQGSIQDFGGSNNQLKSRTSNSIWNSSVIETMLESKTEREKIAEYKAEDKKTKADLDREMRLNETVEAIENKADTRKVSGVTNIGDMKEVSYKSPTNSISIFDTGDFQRIPEKTDGEKVSERARQEKAKDDSWINISKAKTSKDLVNILFEKLSGTDTKNE